MPLDVELIEALERYGNLRKRIHRDISQSFIDMPAFGGRDLLLWIGRLEKPNVTALSDATGITRGGVSKAVARLDEAGLIERYQLPENRKEVYYRLTPAGIAIQQKLLDAQRALDEKALCFVRRLPEAQKQAVLDFMTGYVEHLGRVWPTEGTEPNSFTGEKEGGC